MENTVIKLKNVKIKRGKAESVAMWIVFAVFVIYSVSLVFPFVWMFLNSFKPSTEFFGGNIWGFPKTWRFANYSEIFIGKPIETASGFVETKLRGKLFGATFSYSIFHMFIVSVALTALCTVSNIFFAATSAYVVAKYKFFGRQALYSLAIFLMVVPIAGTLPEQCHLMRTIGLADSFFGVFLLSSAGFGMNFFLMYGFFKNISWTYAEAARVDGAGHAKVFFKIMLPFAMPAIISLAVIHAIGVWNDYTTPSIYMKSMPTLAYGLFVIRDTLQHRGLYTQTFAAMMIALVPILAVFIAFSNTIMENTVAGGLKG